MKVMNRFRLKITAIAVLTLAATAGLYTFRPLTNLPLNQLTISVNLANLHLIFL
jgi:hypothetical protein